MQQEGKEKAGCGNLLPEMDRAGSVRLRLRLVLGLMRISGLARTGKEQPQQPTEGGDIAMIVRIRGQQQEPDGQNHKGRCQTSVSSVPAFPSLASYHLLRPRIGRFILPLAMPLRGMSTG